MTIREMFRKVNCYNEVAEQIGTKKVVLKFYANCRYSEREAKSHSEVVEYLRKTFIDEVADAIINYKGYTLGDLHTFKTKVPDVGLYRNWERDYDSCGWLIVETDVKFFCTIE